jgi:hypothetical protein
MYIFLAFSLMYLSYEGGREAVIFLPLHTSSMLHLDTDSVNKLIQFAESTWFKVICLWLLRTSLCLVSANLRTQKQYGSLQVS